MLSIDTKLQQRKYQLRKVKVIEVFFVEFKVNFSKFNTPQPTPSSSTFAQWNLQKIHKFSNTSTFFHQISVVNIPVHQGSLSRLLALQFIPSDISDYFIPRNFYSEPSYVFRTSYSQKLLLRTIRYFQNILLPELVIMNIYGTLLHF